MNSTFQAINPATGEKLEGFFNNSTAEEINITVERTRAAFEIYRNKNAEEKALFLEAIAEEIESLGDQLLERCHLETALPLPRLTGERSRTTNQLRLFAQVVREGSWVDARIDTAMPDRKPIPRSDIRHMLIPLGPVAVFGASNFPLAFSAAGGDTASALAAGCTVVVKGHPAHPGTTALIDQAIQKAIIKTNMPQGVFSVVQGQSIETGQQLVKHPLIKAVGFTGSFRGGKAIFDTANQRKEPIPVFAEMGSSNPVFILPEALRTNGEKIAQGLAGSINLGVGQFCTNPGLIFILDITDADHFTQKMSNAIGQIQQDEMLTAGIKESYIKGLKHYEAIGLNTLVESITGPSGVISKVLRTQCNFFLDNKQLEEENFGPSSILIIAEDKSQILEAAESLHGHLTATIHGTDEDLETFADLLEVLQEKVGRIVINGYPTGVEVCHAMVHGGPYPATTVSQTTSVGTNGIKRFTRPICFQEFPQFLLPDELKDNNPGSIWRMINGKMSKDTI